MPRFLRQPDPRAGVSNPEERPGDVDIPLVRAAQDGDQDAFGRLIRRHQKKAVAVSYRLLGNREDALEVTQDAFLKAFKSLDTLERPGAFGGWLMRIVSNLSLNYRRGRALRQTADLDEVGFGVTHNRSADGETTGTSPDPLRAAQGKELGDRLQAALNELPEKQRAALVLFTLEGLPQKEVADQLECSVEAVKWHVFQARKKLKGMLEDLL
ncbi:MAG: RNA polymerase sigma factor [Planctomycetota bacterium]